MGATLSAYLNDRPGKTYYDQARFYGEQVHGVAGTSKGSTHILSFAAKALQWTGEVLALNNVFTVAQSRLSHGVTVLKSGAGILPRTVAVFARELPEAYENWTNKANLENTYSLVGTASEAVENLINTVRCFVTVSAIFGTIASFASLIGDAIDIRKEGNELSRWSQVKVAEGDESKGDKEQIVREEKTFHGIKLAKAAFSATAGVVGLVKLFTNRDVISKIALLSLGLASSACALATHFYERNMTYNHRAVDKKFDAIFPATV